MKLIVTEVVIHVIDNNELITIITDDQDDKTNRNKRKSKGGAEKLRDKKRKLLEKDASECKKITDMFPATSNNKKKDIYMEEITDLINLPEQPISSDNLENGKDKTSTEKISSKDKFYLKLQIPML